MRNIKTYEGFFDFLKKKKTKDFPPVSISEIEECLYDISDSDKIKSKLNGHQTSLHWTPRKDVVFKRNNSLSLASDHEDFIDDFIHIYMTPRYDEISKRRMTIIAFQIKKGRNNRHGLSSHADVSSFASTAGCRIAPAPLTSRPSDKDGRDRKMLYEIRQDNSIECMRGCQGKVNRRDARVRTDNKLYALR